MDYLIHDIAPNVHVSDYHKDGLLYCGRCHTPKQYHIENGFLAGRTVACMCDCEAEEYRRERQRREELKKSRRE